MQNLAVSQEDNQQQQWQIGATVYLLTFVQCERPAIALAPKAMLIPTGSHSTRDVNHTRSSSVAFL